MAKRKEFTIPKEFLSQLNEYSYGGYLLFTFDSEGNLVVNSNFDNKQNATSMCYNLKHWSDAIDKLNQDITISIITQNSKKKN